MKAVICDHCGKKLELENEVKGIFDESYTNEEKEKYCWVDWYYQHPTGTSSGKSRQLCWNCVMELSRTIKDFLGVREELTNNPSEWKFDIDEKDGDEE